MAEWLKAHDSKSCGPKGLGGSNPLSSATSHQGVAQLVARAVRDCEVVGSNPITLTKTTFHTSVVGASAQGLSAYGYKSNHPNHIEQTPNIICRNISFRWLHRWP